MVVGSRAGETDLKNTAPRGEDLMPATALSAAAARDRKPNAIDGDHLERMTLGDRGLEREVLELFVRQTTIMLDRIAGSEPAIAAAAAHTIPFISHSPPRSPPIRSRRQRLHLSVAANRHS